MAPSWSSPVPGPGRRGSSWSASAGSWRRRANLDGARRRGTRAPPRQPLRRPPRPGADPRPDLQRQGRRELQERIDAAVGPPDTRPDDRQQLPQLLPAHPHGVQRGCGPARAPGRARRRRPDAPPAGPPAQPRPRATTRDYAFPGFVQFINRAKDELVSPDDFDRFVGRGAPVFEARYGGFDEASLRLETQGNLAPLREVRGGLRRPARQRAGRGRRRSARVRRPRLREGRRPEARRTIAGDGHAHARNHFAHEDHGRIDALADEYERDGAALEILRLERARRRLPRLRGRAGRAAAPSTSASRSPSSRGCSRPGPTSCAAGSASSATSSWTSSRTPTSPRSS